MNRDKQSCVDNEVIMKMLIEPTLPEEYEHLDEYKLVLNPEGDSTKPVVLFGKILAYSTENILLLFKDNNKSLVTTKSVRTITTRRSGQ